VAPARPHRASPLGGDPPAAAQAQPPRAPTPAAALPANGPARQALRFVNLEGTPLEVVEANAEAGGADQTIDPVVRLHNRSARTISEFALAFVVDGRATAVLRDTTDIRPGEEYRVRLPGEGNLHHAAETLTISVIRAETGAGEAWGIAAPPGVLPLLPEFATRLGQMD
jgi:hypothetical protein